MNKFDDELFELVSKDNNEIPEKIDNKINNILSNLPDRKRGRKVSLKVALIAAAITALSVTTVVATNGINFWGNNNVSDYESNKTNIESLSSPINLKTSNKGIDFILDNVALDDSYMYVFYTLESEKNLKEVAYKHETISLMHDYLDFSIDGSDIDGQMESEGYFLSDNTYKGVKRINVANVNMNSKFELKVSTTQIGTIKGDWSISKNIERKDASLATKIVNPNISGTVNRYGQVGKYKVDKIVFSLLGNQIQITEEQKGLDTNFMLFDDKGNELKLHYESFRKNDEGESTNTFEFITQNMNLNMIKLVPYEYIDGAEVKDLSIDIANLPQRVETSKLGDLTIKEVIKEGNVMKIKYTAKGQNVDPTLLLLDENGNRVEHGGVASKSKVDRITGVHTKILTFYNENFDLNSIKKIGTSYSDDIRLLEDQAIEIPLN